jgi:hypothetical protein
MATVAALEPGERESRLPGVREFYDNYREQLVAHHTHEDTLFYPALAARVGDDRMHRDELVAQHHQLDSVECATTGESASNGAFDRLQLSSDAYGATRSGSSARRCSCTRRTTVAPSPTAEATRLIDPCRTSPAAKTPGMLVSSGKGSR